MMKRSPAEENRERFTMPPGEQDLPEKEEAAASPDRDFAAAPCFGKRKIS